MSTPEIDPTQAASERFSRRFFVGISAAATVAVTTGAGASDAPRSSMPDVPEDDPAIDVQRVTLQAGQTNVPAYAAWPSRAGAPAGSVVVIMHIWGVDKSIRSVVRRLAATGFAAIAPDLYAGMGAPTATVLPISQSSVRMLSAWIAHKSTPRSLPPPIGSKASSPGPSWESWDSAWAEGSS